jgi:hypothetical protein
LERGEIHIWFWCGNLREKDKLENLGVDGRITLKWIFKKWDGGIDWIYLAHNRDRECAVVNTIMILRFP